MKNQDTTREKVLKAILRHERDSSIFPVLRHWLSDTQGKSIDKLLIPDDPFDLDNTTWHAVIEKQAIFEALLEHGQTHFSQASDTPFVTGPVAKRIGPFKFNEHSRAILNGTFDIDSISDDIVLRDVVKAMAHSNPASPVTSDS